MENRLEDKGSGWRCTLSQSHAKVKHGGENQENVKKNLLFYLPCQTLFLNRFFFKWFDENSLFTYIKSPETVSKITP